MKIINYLFAPIISTPKEPEIFEVDEFDEVLQQQKDEESEDVFNNFEIKEREKDDINIPVTIVCTRFRLYNHTYWFKKTDKISYVYKRLCVENKLPMNFSLHTKAEYWGCVSKKLCTANQSMNELCGSEKILYLYIE